MTTNDPTANAPTNDLTTADPTMDNPTMNNPTTDTPTSSGPIREGSTTDHPALREDVTATRSTATATLPVTPAPQPTEGPWLRGPAPFAIVLGLLGLLVAGATLLTEVTDVRFPWADLGPWTVVAGGLVVVLVGVIGLRSSRGTQG